MRVLPQAPADRWEAPPVEAFDMQGQTCPHCGSPDAAVQQVEDAEIAKCPQCQCEFSPRLESVTKKVIRQISERRERRIQTLSERLPINAPVRGLDRTDYDLFRKIVDGTYVHTDQQRLISTLKGVETRFKAERIQRGATEEQAEQAWYRVEPKFRQMLIDPNDKQIQNATMISRWDRDQEPARRPVDMQKRMA